MVAMDNTEMIYFLGTVLFILGVGYLMNYLVKIEEENVRKQGYVPNRSSDATTPTSTTYVPELKIHELRSEKYNGLVRQATVICSESKLKIILGETAEARVQNNCSDR